MTPLEASLTRPIVWFVSKPKRKPFYKTVTGTKQYLYRKLIEKLPVGEWRVMRFLLNRWFRHEGRAVAPGNDGIGDGIGYTERQVRRITNSLLVKGFLRVVSGGVGRGNRRAFHVDLWAILQAFAPDLLVEEKEDISGGAYKQELKIGSKWEWFAGVSKRSANFIRRLARALGMNKPCGPDVSKPLATKPNPLIAKTSGSRRHEADDMWAHHDMTDWFYDGMAE